MLSATPAYSQDVTTFSDAEIESLSAEMQEAFERPGYDGDSYWSDDEAETRYYEMRDELRRRHPRPPDPLDEVLNRYLGECMKSLYCSLDTARSMEASSDFLYASPGQWPKIGETIQVRVPYTRSPE